MPALGFQSQHVSPVLVGAKPFTMRRPRIDHKDPRVGDALHLFKNWRQPDMEKFATARCVMRVTLKFAEQGLLHVNGKGLDSAAPPVFASVGHAILEAADHPNGPAGWNALHRLALWDGFDTWADLVKWHRSYDKPASREGQVIVRELIGMAGVTPEPGTVGALFAGGGQ